MKTLVLLLGSIAIAASCTAQQNKRENEKVFNGNTFHFASRRVNDTFELWDPVTMIKNIQVRHTAFCPVSMNGRHIYYPEELFAGSQPADSHLPIEEQILNNYQRMFQCPVEDGELKIRIRAVTVDERGQVVHAVFDDLEIIGHDKTTRVLNDLPLEKILEGIVVDPAIWKGQKVLSERRLFFSKYLVELRDQHVVYKRI